MGKYLKMADVFKVGVSDAGIKVRQNYIVEGADDSFKPMEYAAHAINSHDELVDEVERLRYENEALIKCRTAAREFFNSTVASGGSVKVSSTSKTALDEADKASDWLEAELKATADLVNK